MRSASSLVVSVASAAFDAAADVQRRKLNLKAKLESDLSLLSNLASRIQALKPSAVNPELFAHDLLMLDGWLLMDDGVFWKTYKFEPQGHFTLGHDILFWHAYLAAAAVVCGCARTPCFFVDQCF